MSIQQDPRETTYREPTNMPPTRYAPPLYSSQPSVLSNPYAQSLPPVPYRPGFFQMKVNIPLWLFLLLLFCSLFLIGTTINTISNLANRNQSQSTSSSSQDNQSTMNGNSQDTQNLQPTDMPTFAPSPIPTQPLKCTTVQTFTGNENKKSAVFNAPDDWKMIWSCDPSSSFDGEYNVIVDVNNSDGSPLDPGAINTICKAGNTSDNTEEHQSGDVYLDIVSEGSWKIQV